MFKSFKGFERIQQEWKSQHWFASGRHLLVS